MLLWQNSWSQSGLPKSDPNSILKALINCDNENKRLLIDLQIAIESDSNKTVLIGFKNKRIGSDSTYIINLKKQNKNADDINVTLTKRITALVKRSNQRWWYFGGGAITGYVLYIGIKTLITKL